MCNLCPGNRVITRKCAKCRLWKSPAPPEAFGEFVCRSCDPTSLWNMLHDDSVEPAKVLIRHKVGEDI